MEIKRRDFVKGCAAACVMLVPGVTYAALGKHANKASPSNAGRHIEKSIKASFGGGFSVKSHRQSNGLTHANIEHFGTQYAVTSADLLDWKIVRSV
ncbi:twin-arginine translocation signal domain-containing protein [Alcaligenaceae bacterium]|nr:twin-arginine translocation signal domain-containing protein [Alcaligenaceae bacterium]